MVAPGLGSGLLVGIAIGLFGIAFWVVGLVVFDYLVDRYQSEPPGVED